MDLRDFLAGSLELLTLLETIERRHMAIEVEIARVEALPAGYAERALCVARLRVEHGAAQNELDRAIALISRFSPV